MLTVNLITFISQCLATVHVPADSGVLLSSVEKQLIGLSE